MSAAPPVPALATDQALLARVLRCYKPHCRYLTSMSVAPEADGVRGRADLAIAESCYIDDTGHLNAVEVNICYNQMLYYTLATAVRERLLPVLAGWSLVDFWRHQLNDILILRLGSEFRAPIDRRRFTGEFEINAARRRRLRPDRPPLVSLDTAFRCWDEAGGAASGRVTVGIVESSGGVGRGA